MTQSPTANANYRNIEPFIGSNDGRIRFWTKTHGTNRNSCSTECAFFYKISSFCHFFVFIISISYDGLTTANNPGSALLEPLYSYLLLLVEWGTKSDDPVYSHPVFLDCRCIF